MEVTLGNHNNRNFSINLHLIVGVLLVASLAMDTTSFDGRWQKILYIDFQFMLVFLLIYAKYLATSVQFIFSCGFWLIVNVFLYLFLKVFYLDDADLHLYGSFHPFLILFLFTFAIFNNIIVDRGEINHKDKFLFTPTNKKLVRLLIIYTVLKFFSFAIKIIFTSGADTQLEMAAASQNQGMSYIFNLGNISWFIFYLILFVAYSSRKWIGIAIFLSLISLVELIFNANRMGLINFLLFNAFFYNRYVKRINILYLLPLAPLVIFIVAFFGVVRDIGIGDFSLYAETFGDLISNFDSVLEIFMHRLDLLDMVILAWKDYLNGNLPILYGKSYIYTFLHSIPRNIWPDKPLLTAALITSIERPGHFANGVNFYCSIVLEGLMNLGTLGVVLSGALTGYLSKILDRFKESNNGYKVMVYISAFTFPMGLFNEGVHSNFAVQLLYQLFLIGVTVFLINVKFNRT